MFWRRILISILVVSGRLLAQEAGSAAESVVPDASARLLEAARSPERDFFAAYDAARDAGVPEAKLVQARLVKALVGGDLRGLIGMIDKIEKYRDGFDIGFDPKESGKFAFVSTIEVNGLVHALKAVKAFQEDDDAAFEQHAKAAYWTWPRWAQTFQVDQLLAQRRIKDVTRDYVAKLTLPLDTPLRDLDDKPLSLGEIVAGHKAVLLDFWASWCGPCMRSMPELQERANALPSQGVAVVAVNTDSETPLEKARKVKEEKSMDMTWLVEAEKHPLSAALFVDSIPRAVLIAPDGRVLFSGHPADDGLKAALRALGVDAGKSFVPRIEIKGAIGEPSRSLLDGIKPP